MRLASLTLRNFRGFRDTSIQLERGTLLIGANDVGKSTILEAIRFLLTDESPGDQRWRYEEMASGWQPGAKDVGPVVVTGELVDPDETDREGLGSLVWDDRLVIGRYLLAAKGSPEGWEAPGKLHVVLPAHGMPEGWKMPTFQPAVRWGEPVGEREAAEDHNESTWVNTVLPGDFGAAVRHAMPTCVHFPPPDEPPASIFDVLEPLLAAELGRRMESAGLSIERLGDEAAGIMFAVGQRLNDALPRYLRDAEGAVAEMDWDRVVPGTVEALNRAAFATLAIFLDRRGQGDSILGRPTESLRSSLGPRLGSGARRLAALACLETYLDPELWDAGRSIVLTIEEPEASLHPEAQRRVARLLRELPSANVQTVVVTHSPLFINAANPTGVRLVRATFVEPGVQAAAHPSAGGGREDSAVIRDQEVVIPEDFDEIASELGATRADVLQASIIVMVEGASDSAIIGTWCRKAGIDPSFDGVVFVPCRGAPEARRVARLAKEVNPPARLLLVLDADGLDERQMSLLRFEAGERLEVFVWREAQIEPYLALPAVRRWLVATGATPTASLDDEVAALTPRRDRKEALRDLTRQLLGREYDVVDDGRRIARFMEPSEFDSEVVDLLRIIRSAMHAATEPSL